jgi:hypothetical protein
MDTYVLIQWPESQSFMEEPWFDDEAILALGAEEQTGSSAYFIPEERLLNNDTIITRVKELCNQFETTAEEDEYVEKEFEGGLSFEGGMSIPEAIIIIKNTDL